VSRTALFAGTFDPVTRGHLDLVERARRVFDRVVVAVSEEGRATLLDAATRTRLVRASVGEAPGVEVISFCGLVVEVARAHGACALLRGVRGPGDWEGEMQMATANRHLGGGLDTLFLPPSPGTARLSSSLVREVFRLGGDVSAWVTPPVLEALERTRSG
jgi:pantetheine-phosphate adenylyltransferase